jgi:hypothetical protein
VKVGQERILTGYTRSKGRCNADFGVVSGLWSYPDILVEAHPHIGTNKFQIIQDIRENYRMWRAGTVRNSSDGYCSNEVQS